MILLLGCANVPKCECKCECITPVCERPYGQFPYDLDDLINRWNPPSAEGYKIILHPPFGSYGDSNIIQYPFNWHKW